jgi:hypothetical protein
MKKTIKSNPLKAFNDNKSLAVKKMGGAQASFKKSLSKVQTGGTGSPKSTTKMLEVINQNPSQYKRDRTPDVKKIYTDRNIPLTGPMSSSDSLKMGDIETGLWNDTSGRKASTMAIGCKKMKTGGVKKSLPEAQLGGTLAGLKKLYKMYNTVSKASKAATIANKKNTKPKK